MRGWREGRGGESKIGRERGSQERRKGGEGTRGEGESKVGREGLDVVKKGRRKSGEEGGFNFE